MNRGQPRILVIVAIGIVCSVGYWGVGCTASVTPVPTVAPVTPTPSVSLTMTPKVVLTPTVIPLQTPRTLGVWIVELVSPVQDTRQSQLFAQHIASFQATHPDLAVEILWKKRDGKGGIRDFLTTASAVAPSVVPDVIALDTQTLIDIAHEGLVVPLDGLLSPALLNDLYPFATQSCTVDERLVCVQFLADVEHAVYYTSKIAVAPLTWDEIFASGATYIFPMAGRDSLVNDAFLIQYLSTGSDLVDSSGNPALDQQALADVLSFYRQGIESGVILTDSLTYQRVEECWPKYLQAEVVISNLSSNLYLAGRSLLEPVSVITSIPTRDGQTVMLSQGYAWAMTTRDPERWAESVKLIEWLMYPTNLAAWNQAAGHLPTRRSAFEQMPRDIYVKFMYGQLENARPYPSSETHLRIYAAMQTAVNDVLHKDILPAEAAASILSEVGQETTP